MTTIKINRAIKHLGVEIIRGYGYVYFLSLGDGSQVGESVMVPYLICFSLERWVEEAKFAVKNAS